MTECITPQADGSFNAVFGWEFRDPGTPTATAAIPVGATNQLTGGTIVTGPPTQFDYPVGGTTPAHVVWPPFVWDPPTRMRAGRTMWWPVEPAVVNIAAGGTARYRLGSRTGTASTSANFQRCSQHVFVTKDWNGSPTPPPELDKQAYELVITHSSNSFEPAVLNAGVSRCRYLEYATPSTSFAPYGTGFTTTESDRLNCAFENTLPYSTDIGGYWVPRGTTYNVAETGLPTGWTSDDGIGDFTADHADPSNFAQCTYYPSFGTAAAVLDSDGSAIPEFGRASPKWCRHEVSGTLAVISADLSVAKVLNGTLLEDADAAWTLTVTNSGPGADPGPIVVTDMLPDGATFASADSDAFTCTEGPPVVCTADGPLSAGSMLSVMIVARLDSVGGSTLTNVASVSGGGTDNDASNDSTSVSGVVQATATTTTAAATTTTTTTATTTEVTTTTSTGTTAVDTGGELPATGRSSGSIAATAGSALALGALLIMLARRRPRHLPRRTELT